MPEPKTVAQKLGIKPGDRVYLEASPTERALLQPLPNGVESVTEIVGAAGVSAAGVSAATATVAVAFVSDRAALQTRFAAVLGPLAAARAVWFCYPKAGRADVNRDIIMRECGAFGWRAISNVAIDETWSAVRVRPLRDGEAPLG